MAEGTETAVAAGQIRELLDRWQEALNRKDIEGLMSFYAPEVIAFDVIPPLRFVGVEAYRRNWQMGLEMCSDDGTFETHELHIAAGPEVAFCHRLNRMAGTTQEGEPFECWIRWTVGFQKIDGRWLITHEHISAPIDMATNQAVMDLKPTDP